MVALAELVEYRCSARCHCVGLDVCEGLGRGQCAVAALGYTGADGLDDLCAGSSCGRAAGRS